MAETEREEKDTQIKAEIGSRGLLPRGEVMLRGNFMAMKLQGPNLEGTEVRRGR